MKRTIRDCFIVFPFLLLMFCVFPVFGAIQKLTDEEDLNIFDMEETSVKTGAGKTTELPKANTDQKTSDLKKPAVIRKVEPETKTGEEEPVKSSSANSSVKQDTKKLSGLLKDLPKFDDPVDAVKSRLTTVLSPYKLSSSGREPIDNAQLSEKQILSWRFVFTKNFNKKDSDSEMESATEEEVDDGKGNVKIETKQPKQTYAVITLIPAGALDLEKALLLKREVVPTDKYLKNVMFVKYGITWSKFPCQYERLTYYLGSDSYFHYFASADISVIYTLYRALDMKDGGDLTQIMVDNLLIEDENYFTKRFCIAKLAEFRDPVIPALVRAIRRIVSSEEYPIPHFITLTHIHTMKSFTIICDASESSNKYLRGAAFSAMMQLDTGIADLLPAYSNMVKSRDYITYGSLSILHLGLNKYLSTLIQEILDKPHSIREFEEATRIKWMIQQYDIKTVHKVAYDEILLLSARSGELKDSPQFIDMNESKAAREARLQEEDKERIAEPKKRILDAKEVDLSIITSIELAFFYTADKRVSRDYINRVNRVGISLLQELPKSEVSRILNLLIRYNTSAEESAKLKDVLNKVGK